MTVPTCLGGGEIRRYDDDTPFLGAVFHWYIHNIKLAAGAKKKNLNTLHHVRVLLHRAQWAEIPLLPGLSYLRDLHISRGHN